MFWSCADIQKKCCVIDHARSNEDAEEEASNQKHVFAFYGALSKEQKRDFDTEWLELEKDFGDNCENLTTRFLEALEHAADIEQEKVPLAKPSELNWELKKLPTLLPGANLTRLDHLRERKLQLIRTRGFELYSKGHVGVVLLAGGLDEKLANGTSKGMIDIGLQSQKSIFQLYAERLRRLQHLTHRKSHHAAHVPLYIMCNQNNSDAIADFFEKNSFFGLQKKDVLFFTQRYYPGVDLQGKLMLSQKHKILQFPCGNGDIFRALLEDGIISDMKSRGVSCLYVSSTDNVLAKIGDPIFIGHCDVLKAQCGVKCVRKESPEERLGAYCSKTQEHHEDVDGDGIKDLVSRQKATVVEYVEMGSERNRQRGSNGESLEFSAGNLSQYYFKLDFVPHAGHKMRNSFHLLSKELPHIDITTGQTVHHHEHDGYSFEKWIFDSFEHSSHVVGFEVSREECGFVKNATGTDSPLTALQAVALLHQSWILKAGGTFADHRTASDKDDAQCEISPLVSYEGENLDGICLAPIQLPFYMPSYMETAEGSFAKASMPSRSSLDFFDQEKATAHHDLMSESMGMDSTLSKARQAVIDYSGERADEFEALPPTPRETEEEAELPEQDAQFVVHHKNDQDHVSDEEEEDEDNNSADSFDDLLSTKGHSRSSSRPDSVLGDSNSRHMYGGAWSRNTGRAAIAQNRSKRFWGGPNGAGSTRSPAFGIVEESGEHT